MSLQPVSNYSFSISLPSSNIQWFIQICSCLRPLTLAILSARNSLSPISMCLAWLNIPTQTSLPPRGLLGLHRAQLFATLWTVAHQVPLSMGCPRQEYWSGLPFPSLGIEPVSPAWQADSLPLSYQGSPCCGLVAKLCPTVCDH